jgi:hypothetical protein
MLRDPLLDGVRWIGQYHVKALKAVALHKLWLRKGVTAFNPKILNAVQKAIHPGDGRGHQVPLLPVKPDIAPFFFQPAQMRDTREQHAAGAARRIINGFTRLNVEHLGHQMNDGAVGWSSFHPFGHECDCHACAAR